MSWSRLPSSTAGPSPAHKMEYFSGSIYFRVPGGLDDSGKPHGLKPGQAIAGHAHQFSHTTFFINGHWRVVKWGLEDDGRGRLEWTKRIVDEERDAPFHLLVEANIRHEFTYVGGAERGYAYCVYARRGEDGEASETHTGWHKSYN